MTESPRVVAGRYTVIRELGRGGMGVVWLAEDQTIGRRVAIKELLLPAGIPLAERHVFEERVLREARTAGRLSDPGIVTVHDVVQVDGATFIVMELIEAPNLSEVIQQHGALPVDQVLKVAEQLLLALQTAHAAGVIHRDVKPSNVMCAANGRVKLADFGIAQTTEDSRLTTSGTLVGSPTYISPERLLGRDASPASDLWALGATLFFAVEGYGAYDRQTTAASIQAIMNERAQVRNVQGPLADLIMGLLDPNPDTRLTAGQAHYLIDQARFQPRTGPQPIQHQPIQQHPITSPPQTPTAGIPSAPTAAISHTPPRGTKVLPQKKVHRGLAITAVVAFVVAATVATLAITGVFDSDSSHSSASADSPAGPATTSSSKRDSGSSGSDGAAGGGYAKPKSMQPALTYGPGGQILTKELGKYGAGGMCFNGSDLGERVDDCEQPHDGEVFDHVELNTDSETWPGSQKVTTDGEMGCADKYSEITTPDKDNVLKIWTLVPSELAWRDERRKAFCVAARADGAKLTGSVAGN
jgi:serine/threonine protein kinase